jgi:hypothetical protein
LALGSEVCLDVDGLDFEFVSCVLEVLSACLDFDAVAIAFGLSTPTLEAGFDIVLIVFF